MNSVPQMRSQGRALDDDLVWAAYLAGTPIADLMAQFACSRHTLKRSLRRAFLRTARHQRGNQ
jgi:hypothetical protein